MQKSKYIIAGAGLSGLVAAYQLNKSGENNFIILEGRDRIGGRIHTHEEIDLGATWFQDHHQHLSQLIDDLGIQKFRQYSTGKGIFIYSSMAPPQYFESDPNTPSGYRIAGGSIALINKLANPVQSKIKLNHRINKITESDNLLQIETASETYITEKLILAIPPKVICSIEFEPGLPDDLIHAMQNTHTWMSNAIKVGISYDQAFWRDKKLSGTLIGHVGPTIELYDHSNIEDQSFSLMGFVNEGLRDESPENRKERILNYIAGHFGDEAKNYTGYFEKDWSLDSFTSNEKLKSVYISPRYGNPIFNQFFLNGKLLIACAETSPVHGGYMDGAVISGMQAAKSIRT